jgi:glycosyltransferase involved in cell wall biosynthesis
MGWRLGKTGARLSLVACPAKLEQESILMNAAMPRVVISNGYSQFNTAHLAAELHAKAMLNGLITGAYPRTDASQDQFWGRYATYRRYRARRVAVPNSMVWPIWSGEALSQVAQLMWRLRLGEGLYSAVARSALVRYQNVATTLLRERVRPRGNIYHYRSGFGGASARAARDLGMKVLCDHSIVHPSLLEPLLENGGQLPPSGERGEMNAFWRTVEEDLSLADVILVNSHFVQETFVRCGIARERTQVVYWGPDKAFLDALDHLPGFPPPPAGSTHYPLRVLTAGTMEARKGSHILAMALNSVSSDRLDVHVVGDWHRRLPEHRQRLEALPHVRLSPNLDRDKLAQAMARADVFAFPTLAEGSARVIFEAMAAGCYIITTPNAGSIVRDGVHGRLIRPSNVSDLCAAIEEAKANVSRAREIGRTNALAVRAEYGPASYGQRIADLYRSLLADG